VMINNDLYMVIPKLYKPDGQDSILLPLPIEVESKYKSKAEAIFDSKYVSSIISYHVILLSYSND
jgi:hypothetical protein